MEAKGKIREHGYKRTRDREKWKEGIGRISASFWVPVRVMGWEQKEEPGGRAAGTGAGLPRLGSPSSGHRFAAFCRTPPSTDSFGAP